MVRLNNPFWKDAVKDYKTLCNECCPLNVDEFGSECIQYNVNITREKKVVYIKDQIHSGIVSIRQLLGPGSVFLNYDEFVNQFRQI